MPKTRLPEAVCNDQLDRLRMLRKFPEIPAARDEMLRTLRDISQGDVAFLAEVITYFVDHAERCPRPQELRDRAGELRKARQQPLGNRNCPKCHGTGWTTVTRMVHPAGMEPYEAEYSGRCDCGAS